MLSKTIYIQERKRGVGNDKTGTIYETNPSLHQYGAGESDDRHQALRKICYVRAREAGADEIHDNFPKYVVSLDEFDMSRNGIKHRNICDFLLDEKWE